MENSLTTGMLTNLESSKNHKYRTKNKIIENKSVKINSPAKGLTEIKKLESSILQTITPESDIEDMPIYFQGWIKYLHFKDNTPINGDKKSKQFYKNNLYDIQMKERTHNQVLKEKDKYGQKFIPSELHFYAILYKNSLNIFSSREDKLLRTIDTLNIDFIKPIPEGKQTLGGVLDFGFFSEGYCMKVLTTVPLEPFIMTTEKIEPKLGSNIKWVICLENKSPKEKLMNFLIKLKLKKQHAVGIYLEADKKGKIKQNTKNTISNIANDANLLNLPNNSIDGYWMLLQDWAQCTMKCGGGLQYKQLLCIPPKTGGVPCLGSSIRTKPCNTQDCPILGPVEKQKGIIGLGLPGDCETKSAKTLPPIIKVMPISTRPLKYDKCFIKEGDALMVKNDKKDASKIPVRIVMNDKTLTIFQDDSYRNMITSYVLKEITLSRVADQHLCFILNSPNGSKSQYCQLTSSTNGSWVEEWDYDFNLFKNQCYVKRSKSDSIIHVPNEIEKKINKKLNNKYIEKVQELKLEIVNEQKKFIEKHIEEDDENKYEVRITKARDTQLKAMQKETKLEQLLEEEEVKKEKNETTEFQEQIDHEEKKNDCLIQAIKEKQIEDQRNLSKSHQEDNITEIAKETKKNIVMKRLQIKQKLKDMKKRQELKKSLMKNKIISIRTTLVKKLREASKTGKIELCYSPQVGNQKEALKYCENNFATDYAKFNECKECDNFCYVCCENEFGDLHMIERDKCYNKCDKNV